MVLLRASSTCWSVPANPVFFSTKSPLISDNACTHFLSSKCKTAFRCTRTTTARVLIVAKCELCNRVDFPPCALQLKGFINIYLLMRELHFFVHMEMIQCASRMRWQSLKEMHWERVSVLLNLLFIGRKVNQCAVEHVYCRAQWKGKCAARRNRSNQLTLRLKDLLAQRSGLDVYIFWTFYLERLWTPDNTNVKTKITQSLLRLACFITPQCL